LVKTTNTMAEDKISLRLRLAFFTIRPAINNDKTHDTGQMKK